LSSEFLASHPTDIAGMVFVDANQEHTLEVLDWRQPMSAIMSSGVDYFGITGLSKTHKLTPEEWQLFRATETTAKFEKQAALEYAAYPEGFPVLGRKNQLHQEPPILGGRPVCVVKGDNKTDMQKLYDAGTALVDGNEAQRAAFKEFVRTMHEKDQGLQLELLTLSSQGRYIEVSKAGHNVQLSRPDVIVEAVKWVMNHL